MNLVHRLSSGSAGFRWLRILKAWLRPRRINLSRVTGQVEGATELTMLCGVFQQNRNYLLRLFFGAKAQSVELGGQPISRAYREPTKLDAHAALVLFETDQEQHAQFGAGWFFLPSWVSGEVSLPLSAEARRTDAIRSTFRRIRKYGFESEVTQDEARLKEFYHTMYRPFIQRTHGDTAFIDSYEEKRAQCKQFDLVLLRTKERPAEFIAGNLILYEPSGPRLWSIGVLDGDEKWVQAGALAALYVCCFEHLHQKGFTRVSLGSSRPFLRDGSLKFKRSHTQRLAAGSWQGWALKILRLDTATRAFLLNQPFISGPNHALQATVFTETSLTVELVTQMEREFFHPGLERLVIYTFLAAERFSRASLPPELAARVEIRFASELIAVADAKNLS